MAKKFPKTDVPKVLQYFEDVDAGKEITPAKPAGVTKAAHSSYNALELYKLKKITQSKLLDPFLHFN